MPSKDPFEAILDKDVLLGGDGAYEVFRSTSVKDVAFWYLWMMFRSEVVFCGTKNRISMVPYVVGRLTTPLYLVVSWMLPMLASTMELSL